MRTHLQRIKGIHLAYLRDRLSRWDEVKQPLSQMEFNRTAAVARRQSKLGDRMCVANTERRCETVSR